MSHLLGDMNSYTHRVQQLLLMCISHVCSYAPQESRRRPGKVALEDQRPGV
jgi:hypothetical protein